MKIKAIDYWKQDMGNTRPYTISYKTVDEVEVVFFEISLENGITGIGSANPSPYVVGESTADVHTKLSEGMLDYLIGCNIHETPALCQVLVDKFPQSPGIRTVADLALHDAFTRHLGIPLVSYFGQKIEKMATSITIGIKNVEETLEEARDYFADGFSILKVKLGKSVDEDVERLVKLREKFGYKPKIRIDCNQGYSVEDLKQFFHQTAKLDIELNEQPLPADQIDEMKALPDEIKDTVAADECLVTPEDAFHLASPPRASGIFNIKLMKCGGIYQARKIAVIAENAGIDLMWGCNDESIVSITAGLHVAFSSANTKYIDLDGSLDMAKDAVKGGFILKDGYMMPNGKPGLGVDKI